MAFETEKEAKQIANERSLREKRNTLIIKRLVLMIYLIK